MRTAASVTSAKVGTSTMASFQLIEFGDKAGSEIITQLAARALIEAGALSGANQASVRRFAGCGQHALLECHGKQHAHHRFVVMVVEPPVQAIGVDGAATAGRIAEYAGPILDRGAQMRAAGEFWIRHRFAGEPVMDRRANT